MTPERSRSEARGLPLLLIVLALVDLRMEFLLLLDHFTFTSLIYGVRHHALAVMVLLAAPSLWRRYS